MLAGTTSKLCSPTDVIPLSLGHSTHGSVGRPDPDPSRCRPGLAGGSVGKYRAKIFAQHISSLLLLLANAGELPYSTPNTPNTSLRVPLRLHSPSARAAVLRRVYVYPPGSKRPNPAKPVMEQRSANLFRHKRGRVQGHPPI